LKNNYKAVQVTGVNWNSRTDRSIDIEYVVVGENTTDEHIQNNRRVKVDVNQLAKGWMIRR